MMQPGWPEKVKRPPAADLIAGFRRSNLNKYYVNGPGAIFVFQPNLELQEIFLTKEIERNIYLLPLHFRKIIETVHEVILA